MTDVTSVATALIRHLRLTGQTVAVAESLTGGLVMATLTEVPGASQVLRGGPVVYATETKSSMLGVDDQLLDSVGPVHRDVAAAMARSVRVRWGADIGLSTTGVAGPDPQGMAAVGQVFIGVSTDAGDAVEQLTLAGGTRQEIRAGAVDGALALLASHSHVLGGEAEG